ncbi:hypothetical protein ACJ72_02651 [Emergomyces africanus]|uniref:Uncharacterized protein n=1 Tax=Emergomyces africanus TaxID=1955775 RepID=A0A1B7P1T3_9EURO|nr:hypothetical protein ACJ72_02651 [Emergomyces africanus]
MTGNCWYRPSCVGSASNIPFFPSFEGGQMTKRRGAAHRILKTTSADNSPSRIAKRDMIFNHCHGQRRAIRNSAREQSFHSALLGTVPDERPASSLSCPQEPHNTYPRTRTSPSPTWQGSAYQPSEMLTSSTYMTSDGFHTPQHVTNLSSNQAYLPIGYPHRQLDIANRNSIYVMESLSSDSPTTNYLISSTGYGMPLANDVENGSTPPTRLLTPNIIPTRHDDSEPKTPLLVPDRNEPGEELVGVGLYDEPEGLPRWDYSMETYLSLDRDVDSLISLKRPGGKGLKLEETFDPSIIKPLQDDDDSDDEDSRDKSDIEKGRDDCSQRANQGHSEIQTPENPKPWMERMMQASHSPFEYPPHIQQNEPWVLSSQQHDPESSPIYHLDMAGRSFFFEDEQHSDLIISKPNQHAMGFLPNMYLTSYGASGYGWV